MAIYVVQLLLILAFALVFRIRGINQRFWYLALSFSTLMVFAAVRAYTIGTDTTTYFWVFTYVQESPSFMESFAASRITAPVYVAYNWLIALLFGDYRIVLIVNSLIIGFGIALFIYKSSSNVVVSTLLFVLLAFYFQSMNGMRQYVAIALAINGYLYFSQKGAKSLKGWVLFLCAVGVHTTAAVFAPVILCLLLMRRTRDVRRFVGQVAILAILCTVSLRFIVEIFVAIFPYYGMYDGVKNIDIFASDYEGRIVYLYLVLFVIACVAYLTMKPGKRFEGNDMVAILFPMVILASFVGIVFSKSFLINRLLWFFMISFISFIPDVALRLNRKGRLLAYIGSFSIFAVWWIAQLIEDQHDVIPFLFG